MSGFIRSKCDAGQKVYTKVGECAMFEGTPAGFILHHKDEVFPVDEAAFNTKIQSGIIAAGNARVTPLIGSITDYQVTGGDVKTSQEGFGPETPIDINAKRVDYIINSGGLCLLRQLKKLNGREVRLFQVDKTNMAYGTIATIGSAEVFRGFLARVWAAKRDNNGSQNGAIIFSVFYGANYGNEENHLASAELTQEYEGLTGVILKKTASGKAKFIIACSGEDLTATYGATLADATLYRNDAGAAPSTVAYNAPTEDLTFSPAGKYRIADAAALIAEGIEGYEGEDEYINLA
jgi:hypothetical protein